MIKQISYLAIAFFCLISVSVNAQSLWTESSVSTFRDANEEDKMVLPENFIAYALSYEDLKIKLENAPNEKDKKNGIAGTIIKLPLPDGSFESFEIFDSPVFAPKLAAKYPSIKSYKGKSLKTPGMNVRFDTGPYGLHAAIHSVTNVFYIDPYARENTGEYLTYDVKDHISQIEIPVPLCGLQDELKESNIEVRSKPRNSVPVDLHIYRFALACTGEWGAVRGTVENALADMNTGVNRINQIFENELAIRLVLINNNDLLLNFSGATDPYSIITQSPNAPNNTADEGNALGVNTAIINSRIGLSSYDIGHLYHTGCNVGGIANLGTFCNNFNKANGLTCHFNNNINYIAANTTSHELGHQMSAQHTFNNCGGNESPGNAFEPGSGTTIMSYAGACGQQNVVANGGDTYYHVSSLIQIYNHTRGDGIPGDGCAEILETSNLEPTLNILQESGFTIPENTYFYLEGEAEDENEDDLLTYTWEQMNRGPTSNLGSPIGDAPHFRSLLPGLSPLRFFPSTDNIMNGSFDKTEVLFEGNRTVNFILTVRDNNAEAGTAVWEEIQFDVVDTPVKFGVTSQDASETYTVGDEIDITWNVAGTDLPPVSAERVDILLFTGNAATFSLTDETNVTVLAKSVFNSGSCKVIIPNNITNKGRIIIKASESIFFSLNTTNVKIEELNEPSLFVNSNPLAQIECLPYSFIYEISSEEHMNIEGDITYTVLEGLPDGATVSFEPEVAEVGASSIMTISPPNNFVGGDYQIRIGATTESMETFSRLIYMNLRSDDHRTIDAISPEKNEAGIGISPTFSWEESVNAVSYTFELSTSPTFGSSNIAEITELTVSSYKPEVFLEKNTAYYWRVLATNYCGDDPEVKIFAFTTESLFCLEVSPEVDVLPINISGSGLPTIQAPLEVSLMGNVADVNVKRFFGEHENNKDMVVTLISPEGKKVILVSKKCEQSDFNCGFDDDSDIDVKCPLNNGNVYNPVGSLTSYNGDELEGTWIFQIEDTKAGNGGKLEGVIVEFCSSQVLDNPYIFRNEKISLLWDETETISSDLLEAKDDNNSSEELIYTIVELPKKGTLTYDGNTVNVGDQFSQNDVDDNKLIYNAISENYDTYFSFTIIDGEGGFIGITDFDIKVSETVSVDEQQLQGKISIYPIPTSNFITIDFTRSSQEYQSYEILNLQGQSVLKNNLTRNDKVDVDVSLLSSGFYIVNLRSDKNIVSKKIIVN